MNPLIINGRLNMEGSVKEVLLIKRKMVRVGEGRA